MKSIAGIACLLLTFGPDLAAAEDAGTERSVIYSGSKRDTRGQIEPVLDRNKGAIYALYHRALRDDPDLRGRFSFRLQIAKTGEVTDCTVLSSELGNPELERRLCARLRLVRFGELPEAVTVDKFIEFVPALQ
jgi:hypothetical protein